MNTDGIYNRADADGVGGGGGGCGRRAFFGGGARDDRRRHRPGVVKADKEK